MVNRTTGVVIAIFFEMLACTAKAQDSTYLARPDGVGGYSTYGPDGQAWTTRPDGVGGYSTSGPNGYSSATRPDGIGGFSTTVDTLPSLGYGPSGFTTPGTNAYTITPYSYRSPQSPQPNSQQLAEALRRAQYVRNQMYGVNPSNQSLPPLQNIAPIQPTKKATGKLPANRSSSSRKKVR